MQTPEELSQDELVFQALEAGRNDMPQAGWTYLGGTNTDNPGGAVSFIIDLAPGDYHLAASYYVPDADSEAMSVVPLTVTEADAAPDAAAEPPATVNLEETDDMKNTYSMIVISAKRFAESNVAGAQAFVDWIKTDQARKMIAEFGVAEYGEPLFFNLD